MRYIVTLIIGCIIAYYLPTPATTPSGILIKIGVGLVCWIILSLMVKGK